MTPPGRDGGEQRRTDAAAVSVLGLALAFFLALTAYWVFDEIGRARTLRDRMLANFETRTQVNRTFSNLQDAESSERDFIITGSEPFLQPYERARTNLPGLFAKLEREFADEPDQAARLRRLRALSDAKMAELAQTIALRRAGRDAEASAVVRSGRGLTVMEGIRQVITELREREAAKIRQSTAEDARRSAQTERIIMLLFLGLLIGSGATVILIRRYADTRRHLLEAIQAEASRERAVFEAAMDGILVVNGRGVIERGNPAAERLFGRGPGELVGRSVFDLMNPASAERIRPILAGGPEAYSSGLRREAAGVRQDGSTFPMEISFAALKSSDDGVLLFVRDISERREVERMKDEFISTVSHELRTPLTSIAGSLGLVASGAAGPLPEKAARLISIAQANSQRLVRLINDVLDLEKIESGKLPFNFQELDLGDVAERAVEGVRGYADQLGVELKLDRNGPARVRGDADRLVQVITNLLSNAAKYSPRGEAVQVTVAREGEKVQLTVADRGPGVPEAFRDRIFTRFAQADSSDARGKSGTGLGLYIAKEIAERHGGRLWYETKGGAVFHLELPAVGEEKAPPPPRDRVLLVEDEPAAQALLIAILEHEGLKVDAAGDLAEARRLLTDASRYGAMVLDLRLPDGDGMDLVREIRARPDVRGVPVVVVSADAARGRDPAVRTLDVVDWMEKPVDPDRLAEMVRSAVGAGAPGNAVILHVDDDRDIREVVATALSNVGDVISAETVAEARELLKERRPDLVILDIELRDGSGLELLDDLQSGEPPIPVVVFSAQDAADLGKSVTAVLVKSRTSLFGLVKAVRELMPEQEEAGA
jgi:PAS domain S-box-containing protein